MSPVGATTPFFCSIITMNERSRPPVMAGGISLRWVQTACPEGGVARKIGKRATDTRHSFSEHFLRDTMTKSNKNASCASVRPRWNADMLCRALWRNGRGGAVPVPGRRPGVPENRGPIPCTCYVRLSPNLHLGVVTDHSVMDDSPCSGARGWNRS